MIRRTALLLLGLVLAVGMAACGGGGDDDADDEPPESSEPAGAEPSGSGERAAEAGTEGDAATEGGTSTGDDDSAATRLGVDRTFTGEGSAEFCAAVRALDADYGGAGDDREIAVRMAEITPPEEIAAEWTNLTTTLAEIGSDPTSEGLTGLDPEQSEQWALDGAIVATYLGDVCGIE